MTPWEMVDWTRVSTLETPVDHSAKSRCLMRTGPQAVSLQLVPEDLRPSLHDIEPVKDIGRPEALRGVASEPQPLAAAAGAPCGEGDAKLPRADGHQDEA